MLMLIMIQSFGDSEQKNEGKNERADDDKRRDDARGAPRRAGKFIRLAHRVFG